MGIRATIRLTHVAALALAVSAAPGWAWGQIFKVTDEDGNVVFTDRPETVQSTSEQDVEGVELTPMNTAPAVNVPTAEERAARSAAEEEEAPKPTVRISSPANESTIAMGPGNFAVSAEVEPPLSRSERLTLLMDGQAIGAAQSSASWFIQGALRGPHDLVVRREGSRGDTVAISEPVRVYVLRPSIIGR